MSLFAPTSKSLSHTRARREANQNGTKGANLPGITEETMQCTLVANYWKRRERSIKYAEILNEGKRIRLITDAGTNITLSIEGRRACADTGIYTELGSFGNLPAGEAYIAPVEGTTEGIIVIDGSVAGVGVLDEPIILRVEKRYVSEISGGKSTNILEIFLISMEKRPRILPN